MLAVDPAGNISPKEKINNGVLYGLSENDRPAQTNIKSPAAKAGINLFLNSDDGLSPYAYAEKKRSFDDVTQQAQGTDVKTARDRMIVLRSTMTEEDFQKAAKDGFDLTEMTPEEAVTILDRIKVDVALGGTQITGYNDAISDAALEELMGSKAAAAQLKEAFAQADLPLTQENAQEVTKALELADTLEALPPDTLRYMTENELNGSIQNLYRAAHSTNGVNHGGGGFYLQETAGYYALKAGETELEGLAKQIDQVIEKAGLDPKDVATQETAREMIRDGIALTPEHLQQTMSLKSLSLPASQETVVQAALTALGEGKAATDGVLTEQTMPFAKQLSLMTQDELQTLKTLEETRYLMVSEVTHSVFSQTLQVTQSSIRASIAMVEDAIAALKQQTSDAFSLQNKETTMQLQQELIPDALRQDKVAAFFFDKQALYTETMQRLQGLQRAPLAFVAEQTQTLFTQTFVSVTDAARQTTVRWSRAGSTYEVLMTAPRADLGDSLHKAFSNVDEILADMNREPNEENRRAVRALAYNRMEITQEKLEEVKAADARLNALIERLRPATVLDMIRNGKNPLEMTLTQMEEYLDSIALPEEGNDEKYAKFLYKMEHNEGITAAEKESFIGIYRLLHTIKKTDGAAIGMVLNTGAEMTMKNLLAAARTDAKKISGIDVRVDASFAGVDTQTTGKQVEAQIASAYFSFYRAKAEEAYTYLEPEKLLAMGDPEEAELPTLAQAMVSLPADEGLDRAFYKERLKALREALPGRGTGKRKASSEAGNIREEMETENRRIATLRQHLLFLEEED